MVLKPNLVFSGSTCPIQASAQEIAQEIAHATVRCFKREAGMG